MATTYGFTTGVMIEVATMFRWYFYSPSHLRFSNAYGRQTIVNADNGKLKLYDFGFNDTLEQKGEKICRGSDHA